MFFDTYIDMYEYEYVCMDLWLTCTTIITESFCNGPKVYSFKTNCISLYLAICCLISVILGGWYKSTKLTEPPTPPFNVEPLCSTMWSKESFQSYIEYNKSGKIFRLYLRLATKVWLRVFGVKNLCNTDGTIDNMASTESLVGSVNNGSRDSAVKSK